MFQASHLPSLDGFRGISIITVLIFHILLKQHKPYFHGDFGVEIFFVISGFIITTLLIKEQVKSRDVSLKNFYIRRILKILPIAYLYLLAITICNAYYHHLAPREIISAALFLKNTDLIPTIANGSTGHFWSLSVEEQFYLIWPAIFPMLLQLLRNPYQMLTLVCSQRWLPVFSP